MSEQINECTNKLKEYKNVYLSAYLFFVSAVRKTVLRDRQLAMFVGCQQHHSCWSGFLVNDTLDHCVPLIHSNPHSLLPKGTFSEMKEITRCPHFTDVNFVFLVLVSSDLLLTRLALFYFLESCSVSMIVSWIVLIQRCWIGGSTSLSLEAGGCKHGACDTKVGATYYYGSQAFFLGAAQSTGFSGFAL